MDEETSARLIDLIAKMSTGRQQISVQFGTGETFLYFDRAIAFLDTLRERLRNQGTKARALIITNGTLATEAQLQVCLERQISLSFSIDGDSKSHDQFRKTAAGEPTHHLALKNWQRYRDMVKDLPDGPICTLGSVVASKNRLADVAAFWKEQGVTRYAAVPALPPRGASSFNLVEMQKRQSIFLADLEQLALSESIRLRGRSLTEEASAPTTLVDYWGILGQSDSFQSCSAAYYFIGVDTAGNLYPCQPFIGFEKHILGDVVTGPVTAKVEAFRQARARACAACSQCWIRFLCRDGCCASDPESGVEVNARGECQYMETLAEIAIRSYHSWRDGTPENAAKEPE
jgi:uncharacterized protein